MISLLLDKLNVLSDNRLILSKSAVFLSFGANNQAAISVGMFFYTDVLPAIILQFIVTTSIAIHLNGPVIFFVKNRLIEMIFPNQFVFL